MHVISQIVHANIQLDFIRYDEIIFVILKHNKW